MYTDVCVCVCVLHSPQCHLCNYLSWHFAGLIPIFLQVFLKNLMRSLKFSQVFLEPCWYMSYFMFVQFWLDFCILPTPYYSLFWNSMLFVLFTTWMLRGDADQPQESHTLFGSVHSTLFFIGIRGKWQIFTLGAYVICLWDRIYQ